jgi:predicted RNA-binding Zn ribbon-like protein
MATSIADLPIVGGHPALDLVNTVEPRFAVPDPREWLTTPDALLTWAQRAGLVDPQESEPIRAAWDLEDNADRALRETVEIREALYRALLATVEPGTDPTQALEFLSHRWATAAGRSALTIGRLKVGVSPGLTIPDRLAQAAVDLMTRSDLDHLRACPPEQGGCGWLFLDHSRNRSRKWCEMDGACGAQAKARRLTERRRAKRAGSARP